MKRTTTAIACSAAALALGLSGCGASFEGSGSKDAASAEQLALRTDDPWAAEVAADAGARAQGDYADGVYVGHGRGMEGAITVTLLLDDGRITCLETTQEGESQSRGGYEAIRDGIDFMELDNFSLVVCKPDRNVIYSGCQWSQMQESAEVGGNVMEKVTVEAARRTETSL